jgi:hypothetical protein
LAIRKSIGPWKVSVALSFLSFVKILSWEFRVGVLVEVEVVLRLSEA